MAKILAFWRYPSEKFSSTINRLYRPFRYFRSRTFIVELRNFRAYGWRTSDICFSVHEETRSRRNCAREISLILIRDVNDQISQLRRDKVAFDKNNWTVGQNCWPFSSVRFPVFRSARHCADCATDHCDFHGFPRIRLRFTWDSETENNVNKFAVNSWIVDKTRINLIV